MSRHDGEIGTPAGTTGYFPGRFSYQAVSRRELERAKDLVLGMSVIVPSVKEPIVARLDKARSACKGQDTEAVFKYFNQALEMAKASRDL